MKYVYLGVKLESSMCWNDNTMYMVNKAKQAWLLGAPPSPFLPWPYHSESQ